MTSLVEALRRLAIELAQRDIPFRQVEQAFKAVGQDVRLKVPERDDLTPWAERCAKSLLTGVWPKDDAADVPIRVPPSVWLRDGSARAMLTEADDRVLQCAQGLVQEIDEHDLQAMLDRLAVSIERMDDP